MSMDSLPLCNFRPHPRHTRFPRVPRPCWCPSTMVLGRRKLALTTSQMNSLRGQQSVHRHRRLVLALVHRSLSQCLLQNQRNAQPVFMPNNHLKPSPNTASAIPVKEVVRPTFNEPKPRPRREFPTDDLSRGQHPTSARSQPQNVAQPLHDRGIRVADTNVPERVTFTPVEPRITQKEPARPPVRRGFVRWCKDKLGIA